MAQQRLGQIDLTTGEILEDGQLVYMPAKRRNGFQVGGWIAMAQHPMEQLANANLGGEALRVFFKLASRIDFENWINIQQSDLAKEMNLKPSSFSRALSKLIAEGVILKGPNVGTRKTYRLNPTYGWKGSAKSHRETLNSQTKLALVHSTPNTAHHRD